MAFFRLSLLLLAATTAILLQTLASVSAASDGVCSACRYTARNCSTTTSSTDGISTSTTTNTAVSVCDAGGKIQIDDVFCDDDDCDCADGKQCASLLVGCTNQFQARARRRCIGDSSIQQRFDRCAIAQGLTDLNATNLKADWLLFKESSAQCVSNDCLAVRQFQKCNVIQCGYLVAAWRSDNDSTYHFVVDGSRASDMSAGTFHAQVPIATGSGSSSSLQLSCSAATTAKITSCLSLQTRNSQNATCDGVYIQYDTSVQLSNTESYDFSKLSWPVWLAVVGSIAAAVVSIGVVGVVLYRFKHNNDIEDENDVLLDKIDKARVSTTQLSPRSPHELRQRTLLASPVEDEVKAAAVAAATASTPV